MIQCDYCDEEATQEGPDGEDLCEDHYAYAWDSFHEFEDEYPEDWEDDE